MDPKVSFADKPGLCRCGYCWRTISSHVQQYAFCSAVGFTRAAIRRENDQSQKVYSLRAGLSNGSRTLLPFVGMW